MSIDNNFTIIDNSSKFLKLLPAEWAEPLSIIARIKDYTVDEYILTLIEGRLQMFVDTGDTVDYEEFQMYMHRMIKGRDVPNTWPWYKEHYHVNEIKKEQQDTIDLSSRKEEVEREQLK